MGLLPHNNQRRSRRHHQLTRLIGDPHLQLFGFRCYRFPMRSIASASAAVSASTTVSHWVTTPSSTPVVNPDGGYEER